MNKKDKSAHDGEKGSKPLHTKKENSSSSNSNSGRDERVGGEDASGMGRNVM
jgi:hypothetical protein